MLQGKLPLFLITHAKCNHVKKFPYSHRFTIPAWLDCKHRPTHTDRIDRPCSDYGSCAAQVELAPTNWVIRPCCTECKEDKAAWRLLQLFAQACGP